MDKDKKLVKSVDRVENGEYVFKSIKSSLKTIPDLEILEKKIVTEVYSLKEISDLVMEFAKNVTQSDYCYVAYVDPENKDSVGVSFSHMTDECDYYAKIGEARFPVRSDGSYGGLLGHSLDTGESFYVIDPSTHPEAHGIPHGHEKVEQFLSVPVTYKDKILGQIVLGNPKEDYNDYYLDIADNIASVYGLALKKLLY